MDNEHESVTAAKIQTAGSVVLTFGTEDVSELPDSAQKAFDAACKYLIRQFGEVENKTA